MAKARRNKKQERQALINSFIEFVTDGYHGIVAVYNRKQKSILVYPQIGYTGLSPDDAREILAIFLSDRPDCTSITFTGAERHQTIYQVARGTGELKRYRCVNCGGKVNRGGECKYC